MKRVNIDKKLLEWAQECDALTDTPLLNWLGANDGECAIVPIPADAEPGFISGDVKEVTYDFMFQVMFQLSETTDDVNTDNMFTLRGWQDWIEEQEEAGNYPDFGDGYSCYELQNLSNMPQLAEVYESGMAKFQFPVRLKYLEEK